MEKIDHTRRNLLLMPIAGAILAPTLSHADSYISIDTIVSKLVAIGVPGLVILAIGATSTLYGGAAIIMGLSTIGGPFGVMGGLAAVALLALAIDALSEYSFEYIGKKVVEGLKEEGKSDWEIRNEINSYPISDDLKNKILSIL